MNWDINADQLESSSDSEKDRKRGKINRKDKDDDYYYSDSDDDDSNESKLLRELPKRPVKKNKKKSKPTLKYQQLKLPKEARNKLIKEALQNYEPYLPSRMPTPQIINEDEQRANIAREIVQAIKNEQFDQDFTIKQSMRMNSLGETFNVYVVERGNINNLGPNFLYLLVIPNVGIYDIPPDGHRVKFSTYDINSQTKQKVQQLDIEPNVGFNHVYIAGYLVLFFYGQESKIKTPQKPHDDDSGFLSRIGNSLFNTTINYVKGKLFKK